MVQGRQLRPGEERIEIIEKSFEEKQIESRKQVSENRKDLAKMILTFGIPHTINAMGETNKQIEEINKRAQYCRTPQSYVDNSIASLGGVVQLAVQTGMLIAEVGAVSGLSYMGIEYIYNVF